MTSIEWLEKELLKNGYVNKGYHSQDSLNHLENLFIQSKEMHEKELFEYWNGGINSTEEGGKSFEQYYQETFDSKGSDAKDVVLGYKTSLDAQMLDSQLPQTTSDKWKEYQDWLNEIPEISDEEIQKKAEEFEFTNGIYGFKQAIRWYREQLKQK
jgi:hypothetical protein